jgi:hypothetical protein
LDFLEKFATEITKAELLRIYWYDGTSDKELSLFHRLCQQIISRLR